MAPETRPVPHVGRSARDLGGQGAGHTRRPRPLVWVGRAVVGLGCSVLLGWMALAISVETRKEKGEEYSARRGFFRQYELAFVVADERDVVRLRTNVRGEDVYVYRLEASPADARLSW